ncbi:MAG: excinuclease ABC subunit UvrA [Opitutaceae bacterium]|nr:excinuclease ABC subunit UvrA [Cytophagales bacterium]
MATIKHDTPTTIGQDYIEVFGAREHNLKNIDVKLPRNSLIVITGISGSGKSSLAFDTIYAEGQRRYMESFSAYARSFIGDMERPDVDKINGLSPVISIEQKTTSRNPRSTVGTTTEIYDFLRLLYARAGEAFSYITGKKMIRQSEDQIINSLLKTFDGQKLMLLAPLVRGRKGHYRELFDEYAKKGFTKMRIDGEITELKPKMQIDRYKAHNIELVVDRILVKEEDRFRVSQSVNQTMLHGKGVIMAINPDNESDIHYFSKYLMDPESGLSYDEPAPNIFSFNSPMGACPLCNGLGRVEEIVSDLCIPNPELSVSRGGLAPLGEYRDIWAFKQVQEILKYYKKNVSTPIKDIPEDALNMILHGIEGTVLADRMDAFEGVINLVKKQLESESDKVREWAASFARNVVCPECNGYRLKKESLHYKIDNKNISELAHMDISQLWTWFEFLDERLEDKQRQIGAEVLKEIRKRIRFLLDVGLEYLMLNRPLGTLSGGEAQRIRLATQIGTQLVGVLYIMDEPSIGLHQRDNVKLIDALRNLRDIGNTVLVVEHDKDMMLASDYLLDIGPGAGRHGGTVVAAGTPEEFLKIDSVTSGFLSGRVTVNLNQKIRKENKNQIVLKGAKGHNLKNVTLTIPLGKMVCITGVSGSGKSSLIHHTLFPILNQYFFNSKTNPLEYEDFDGLKEIDKVIEVDQSPIGRTPRSNPATYTGVFTEIRNLFAQMPESKIRGYDQGRFSFNVKGGRCETCEGAGMRLIEMEFLPDIHVPCETCKGKRYNRETIEVRFKGKSISDILDMTVDQAVEFFEFQPRIFKKIETLKEVGLGYITLGQHATTLSGGEAQRVKLATELSRKDTGKTLYILDEPTTGLHFQDIQHMLDILNKLVEKGNSVLIIEHNLDVIKVADWIIDMGPEGGRSGGYIIAEGTPQQVAKVKESYTGKFLKLELESLN